MAEDPLRDLLSSPLDDPLADGGDGPAASRRRRDWMPGPWLVAGILAGGLALAVGYRAATPLESSTERSPTTSADLAVATTTTIASLPPGFVGIAGERLGVRVERILVRPDAVFVSVSTVVPSGVDGDESGGFDGGLWELELLDGRTFPSNTESRSAASPGFVTVRFPNDGYGAADLAALRLTGVASRFSDDVTARSADTFSIAADGRPVDVAVTPRTFAVDVGVDLELSEVRFEPGSGSLEWELTGSDGQALAAVFPQLTLIDAETGDESAVLSQGAFGGFVFTPTGSGFFEEANLSRRGSVAFSPAERAGAGSAAADFPTGTPLTAELQIQVDWMVYGPASVVIPIDGAPIAEVRE